MHGVVLQNRVFRPARDVSRETFLRKAPVLCSRRRTKNLDSVAGASAGPAAPQRVGTGVPVL
jgi:hypothetical protein